MEMNLRPMREKTQTPAMAGVFRQKWLEVPVHTGV